MTGYLATVLTAPLGLNTHFFSKVRDEVRVILLVSLRVRVKVA